MIEYKPEPTSTVTDGDAIQINSEKNLAVEFVEFAHETSLFLMRYAEFINRFANTVTMADRDKIRAIIERMDPNDVVTAMIAECFERMEFTLDCRDLPAEEVLKKYDHS